MLEQKEQDIINKFETKMISVLQTIDVVLEEISKECDGDSKLKLVLMIDGPKASEPQEECKEKPVFDI